MITTNFSLTYFIVSGEIESSRVPSWLLVMDTEGSLCAHGLGRREIRGRCHRRLRQEERDHRKSETSPVVIPGAVAAVSGDLEEELGKDWEVKIGPREAAHISAFLKDGN